MNGCSHTQLGSGFPNDEDGWTFLLAKKYPLFLERKSEDSIMGKVRRANYSKNGSSNKRIWRTTLDYVYDNNEDKIKETLFIIQWTYVYRNENYIDGWKKNYFEYDRDWKRTSDESWKYIITLQNLFKSMGLKYIMFEGDIDPRMAPDGNKSLDWDSRYVKYIDMKYFFKDGIMNTAGDRKTECGHANEEANKEWSDKLYNFLQGVGYE
tara:strand:- start:578 stop:1204 length:627 start_codon:yes stop_codon:yes gene_type:complete